MVCSCYFNVVNEDPILHSLLTYTTSVKELPCLKRSCDRFELKQQHWAVSHTLQTNYSLAFHHVPQNLETKIFTLTVKRSFYTSPHAKVCFLLEVTIYRTFNLTKMLILYNIFLPLLLLRKMVLAMQAVGGSGERKNCVFYILILRETILIC